MSTLNPLAKPFVPSFIQGGKAFPRLVRQVAVPCKRISWVKGIVTEVKVFDIGEGSQARQNPKGYSRLCKMKYKRIDRDEGEWFTNWTAAVWRVSRLPSNTRPQKARDLDGNNVATPPGEGRWDDYVLVGIDGELV